MRCVTGTILAVALLPGLGFSNDDDDDGNRTGWYRWNNGDSLTPGYAPQYGWSRDAWKERQKDLRERDKKRREREKQWSKNWHKSGDWDD